jgi:hypothetical protein
VPRKPTSTNTTRDNNKPLSEYSKNVNPDAFFNDYAKMSKSEQLNLLKARKAQHYNLSMYLKQEILKHLPKNVPNFRFVKNLN